MALPVAFTAEVNATGAQLDANFAALGALTPIPCVAAGQNTITLTPLANTPTISAYTNYMQFTGVAAQSNTGASTGAVGILATLSIYKPGPSGPVALSGGEIIAGVGFQLMYDLALNSGAGGFHLLQSQLTTAYSSISASLASITRLSIGGGQTITHVLSTLSSITWPALVPAATAESIVALGGCSVGDNIMIGYPASVNSNISYRGYVPNAGSVAVVAQNFSTSTITPTPGSYRATAQGFT